MSSDNKTQQKTHEIEQLSRLSIVYLRNALNNPRWTSGLDEHILGCDILRALPKINVPTDVVRLNSDEATLEWGEPIILPVWSCTDEYRDACRKALKWMFDNKSFPINEHTVDLIRKFNLKA